ncbi:MAG: hypothetical protein ABUK20_05750 [Anaerolineales bacterium]
MQKNQELARVLIARLERLSADSYWAHRASGVRGSLLRWVEDDRRDVKRGKDLIKYGFDVLEKAAREI